MSDLVEKVARVLCIEDGEPNPDRVLKLEGYPVAWAYYVDEARAAIAAVAEWLDAYHKAEYLQSENHASPALRSALEAKP